jgi:RNA-binding protein
MSDEVSPKKKALMPSSPLRAKLRGAGHALPVIVQIGKEGTTAAVLKQLGQALHDHELVKIKIGSESPDSRFEAADLIAAVPDVQLAQILGRTILVYKRDPEKSRYEGGGTRSLAAAPDKRSKNDKRAPRDERPQRSGTLRKKSATSAKR